MTIKETYESKQEELKGLEAEIKEGNAEAINKGEALAKEIADLAETIKKAETAEKAIAMMGTNEEKGEKEMNIKEMKLEELKTQKGSKSFALKAYNDNEAVGESVFADLDKKVVDPQLALTVRSLFGSETISGNALTYYKLGGLEGNISTVAEGAAKPQVHIPYTPVTVALNKIAAFIKETDELLSDAAFLESAIRGRLIYEFKKQCEAYLVGALTATSGLQKVTGSITFDNLLKAKQAVRSVTGYEADAILINPTDLESLLLAKDSNQQYLLGGPAYGSYGNGAYSSNPRIWGLPVVESANVTQGQAVVGAFKAASSVVTKAGEGLRVEVSNSDVNDFEYNRITVRVEERMVLATRVPAAFALVGTSGSSSS